MRRHFTTGVELLLEVVPILSMGKPETNLTFLTYLIGRLGLIRFSALVVVSGFEPASVDYKPTALTN